MIKARMLVIEGDKDCVDYLTNALLPFGYKSEDFLHVAKIQDITNDTLAHFSPEVIYLSLDDENNETFIENLIQCQDRFITVPIIVFSIRNDDEIAIKSVHAGAQSFLCKTDYTGPQLYRLICFSCQRNDLKIELERLKEDYKSIFHNGQPMILVNQDTKQIISSNNAASDLYGYNKTELEQCTIEDLQQPRQHSLPSHSASLHKEYTIHYTKNGELLYLELTESSIIYKQVPALLICINNQTTKVLSNIEEKEAIQRLDAIFQATHDMIFLVNDECKFEKVNKSAVEKLGYGVDELLNMYSVNIYDYITNEEINRQELWNNFLEKGSYSGIAKVLAKNGEIKICSINATANILQGLHLSVLTDITESEIAQRKLEEQSVQIQNILDNINDSFLTVDSNNIITNWNIAAEKITGIKKESVLGTNIWESLPLLATNDIMHFYKEVIQNRKPFNFDYHFNERNQWYNVSLYPSNNSVAIFFNDITAHKKHSLELQEQRNNQSALINSCKDLIWSLDSDLKLISFNEAYNQRIISITGMPAKEGLQLPLKFHNEEQKEKWKNFYKRALQGETYSIEEKINDYTSDNYKIAEINFNPFYEINTGKIKGVACYSHDITLRKAQTEKLQANEFNLEKLTRKLEKIMNSSLDVICSIDKRGKFLQVSNAALNVWGYEPAELIGDYVMKMVEESCLKNTRTAALNIIEGAAYTDFQNIMIHKNGQHIPITWSARWDKDEEIMFCVARDASALKEADKVKSQSEQRISALVQNGTDIVGILDDKANYIYISPNVKKLMGFEPEFLMTKNAFDFIHHEDMESTVTEMQKVLTEKEVKLAAFRYKSGFGEWRWLETVASNQLDNPAIKGIVVSSRDVTNRKKREAERELMIKELLKSNADLKQFSFITSHNLRAPLSNITGILNIIEYEQLNEYNKKMMDMLGKSVSQLGQTINDLSKILIVKNNVNIEIAPIDLIKMFRKVNNVFINTLNDVCADVNLNFKVSHIPFNETYFESILVNLISNAIKYRSPKRNLIIDLISEEDHNGNIHLIFRDNGIGIDLKRHKNKLFGLYQRFHDHTEGHGLGLFIIKSQIIALGGKIELESEVDKGTSFVITFRKENHLALA